MSMDIGTLLAKHALDEDDYNVEFDAKNVTTNEEKVKLAELNIEYYNKLVRSNEVRYNRLKMLSGRKSFTKLNSAKSARHHRRLANAATTIIEAADGIEKLTRFLEKQREAIKESE